MGIAIIALTILVRLILMPMTRKSLVAQKKMKDLQPHLEKIKKDHGHDQKAMTRKTMELYKEHGVNPITTSCLPLLIQFPIFIALYRVFWNFSQFSSFNLLYSFVAKPQSINTHFLWLNLGKPDPLYILPILAGATLFWQTKMMTPDPKKEENQSQNKGQQMEQFQQMFSKQMLYLFPLMTVFIALKFPAALSLYWIVTTLFGIAQQYLILRGEGGASKLVAISGAKGSIVTVKKKQ